MKFISTTKYPITDASIRAIENEICEKSEYEYTNITHLLPSSDHHMARHRFLEKLISEGLPFPSILLVYSPGGNIGNLHYLWKVSPDTDSAHCFELSQSPIEKIKQEIPIFHTRAMRSKKFGRISHNVQPAVL